MKLIHEPTGKKTMLQRNDMIKIMLHQDRFMIRLYRGVKKKERLLPFGKNESWMIPGNGETAYVLAELLADISSLNVKRIKPLDHEMCFLLY